MAANYWESTQRRNWLYTREQLDDLRKKLEEDDPNRVQLYPLPQLRFLSIYFNQRKSLPLPVCKRKYLNLTPLLQRWRDLGNVSGFDNKPWQLLSYTFDVSTPRSRSDEPIHTS